MSQVSDGEPLRPIGASRLTGNPASSTDPPAPWQRSSLEDADTLRPQPRPHEPAPDLSNGAAADFAWLYRQDGSASAVASSDSRTAMLPLDSHPFSQQPAPLPPPAPPRRRNPVIIMIVILLGLTVGAVGGIALLLQSDWRISASGSGESSVEEAVSSDPQHSGPVASLTPTQVGVDCQAPQSIDGAGQPVDYMPEQMSDGRMDTAWRCNGDGVGQVVTFSFPAGTTITEVGLVNGYAKVDPATGVKRYGEFRRITKVTWTFANGTSFQQSLNDGVKTVQKLSVPPLSSDRVTLTIDSSTEPGWTARGRDAVLISEVGFGGPA